MITPATIYDAIHAFHPKVDGVYQQAGIYLLRFADDATQPEIDAATAALPDVLAALQAADEQSAVIKQAAEATMQSARNMVPFVPYFSALQYETRKSIVQRDDLVTHFGKLLMILQSDQKMWGDFIHTLDLWHGLTEAEVLAQDVSDDVMHHVCFAAALFMTAGAASALFPLALKP